ncbi:MAG: hypothetical protein CMI01_16230 [Oceanospirillaceae bacterium]|nr:hypothetical protein [Oceanospirillaceae bacterium]
METGCEMELQLPPALINMGASELTDVIPLLKPAVALLDEGGAQVLACSDSYRLASQQYPELAKQQNAWVRSLASLSPETRREPCFQSLKREQLPVDQACLPVALYSIKDAGGSGVLVHLQCVPSVDQVPRFDTDPLTGLPSAALVRARLEHSVHQSARQQSFVAVLYLELDGFREYQERQGELAANRAIKAIADTLRPRLRQGDTLARTGDDGFLLVLEQVEDHSAVHRVCDKLVAAMAELSSSVAGLKSVSASIGVAISPDDGEAADSLINRARAAMDDAKRQGGNCVRYYSVLPTV